MNTILPSLAWSKALLKERGYDLTKTPFGVLIKKPFHAYLATSDADIIDAALRELGSNIGQEFFKAFHPMNESDSSFNQIVYTYPSDILSA